jgi:hypothetical protein
VPGDGQRALIRRLCDERSFGDAKELLPGFQVEDMEPAQDPHDRRLPAPVEEHTHAEGLRDIVERRVRLAGREPPPLLKQRVLEIPPVKLSAAVQLQDRMIVLLVPHGDRLTGGHHGPGHPRRLGLYGQVPVVQMGHEAGRSGQPPAIARELHGIHSPVVRDGPEQTAVGEVPEAHRAIVAGAEELLPVPREEEPVEPAGMRIARVESVPVSRQLPEVEDVRTAVGGDRPTVGR